MEPPPKITINEVEIGGCLSFDDTQKIFNKKIRLDYPATRHECPNCHNRHCFRPNKFPTRANRNLYQCSVCDKWFRFRSTSSGQVVILSVCCGVNPLPPSCPNSRRGRGLPLPYRCSSTNVSLVDKQFTVYKCLECGHEFNWCMMESSDQSII